ncbi:unnamed protein product [Periconia digitata]|uniref:Cytochrome P450 n=1 Tax=Periconia digitata TaxID=1303443 RepID=A0A9W4XNE3_9PLEO|nr:unnamed protein product [Periconia digitata]
MLLEHQSSFKVLCSFAMAQNAILLATAGVLFLVYVAGQYRRRSKLPPGPPGLPLLGNLLQAPSSSPWVKFQEWNQQYGPLVSVTFGSNIVILVGDYDMAKDLLDKRSATYSARPRMVMAGELMCKDQYMLLRQPTERYLLHQRLESPVLSSRAAPSYEPIQDMESMVLVHNLLRSNNVKKYLEIYVASVAYILMYGFRIITNDEWQMHAAHEVLQNFVNAAQPGAWLVDTIPALQYLPTFLAPFKRHAEAHYQKTTDLHMRNMKQGLDSKSWNWSKDFCAAKEAATMSQEEIAWDLGVLQDAAIETSDVFLQIFMFACISQPDFMATAQKEIDGVVGPDGSRMPGFADMERMPYISAIVEELFRWRHVMPGGVSHASSKDDWYNGYLIPKGATVIPVWKTMREDTGRYENPAEFRPERWLGVKGQPNNWGYGRRICAGRHIAERTVKIAVARILWAFHVRPADGKKVAMDESLFAGGFVSNPYNLDVVFEPRSDTHKMVIEENFRTAEKDPDNIMAGVFDSQNKNGFKMRST